MKRTECPECTGIAIEQLIRSPGELSRIIHVLEHEEARGALVQLAIDGGREVTQQKIQQLLSLKRPDIIHTGFQCQHCGQQFELFCETYHGAGGCWSVVPAGRELGAKRKPWWRFWSAG